MYVWCHMHLYICPYAHIWIELQNTVMGECKSLQFIFWMSWASEFGYNNEICMLYGSGIKGGKDWGHTEIHF